MHRAIDDSSGPGVAPRAIREDCVARLRLMRTLTAGPVTYGQLLARFGSVAAVLEAVPDLARRGGGKPPVVPSRAMIETEVETETVEAAGARYLFLGLPGYPEMLATIPTAPPALIVRGKRALADRPLGSSERLAGDGRGRLIARHDAIDEAADQA